MFNLSDGVKKALLLIPTQPFPTGSRFVLRRKCLAQLEEEKIRAAVEWGSFDNLQNLATTGTFRHSGMKRVNANEPSTFKVRRSKVGGYREDFDGDQLAGLEALAHGNILPELGYCQEGTDT